MLNTTKYALEQATIDFEYKLLATLERGHIPDRELQALLYRQIQSIKAIIKKA